MDSFKHFNLAVIWMVVFASISVPCFLAQDCQQSPQDCNATQVLSDFEVFDNVATSDPEPPTYCETYSRTSLSQDGTTAEYDVVYTTASGDSQLLNDTATFEVVNGTSIDITLASYSDTVYHLTLDYVNGNYCFVGHSNKNETLELQYYYLFNNPDSDDTEYQKCLDKIDGYSGGNITFMHGQGICPNDPPKP